jgi:hypothetical protein
MRRRLACPAAFAVALLVVGQLGALAHEAETRHVSCDEHGEQLEGVRLVDRLHACEHDHWIGVEAGGGDHQDCAIASVLRHAGSAATPAPVIAVAGLDGAAVVAPAATRLSGDRVYRFAPKTSPPAAAA